MIEQIETEESLTDSQIFERQKQQEEINASNGKFLFYLFVSIIAIVTIIAIAEHLCHQTLPK